MPKHEQVGDQAPETNENGFTRMQEEMPSFEEHMQQYKEAHPGAVEDIDKARAMAEVGERRRNEAALRSDLELAIQNGDSKKEKALLNRLADSKVEDLMESLKDYPDGTAFQRTQKSFLTALYKTSIGKKISHMAMLHEAKQEVHKYDQSEWVQDILDDVNDAEEQAGRDYDLEASQRAAKKTEAEQALMQGQQAEMVRAREEADLRVRLEKAIKDGDTEQEREITNKLADAKVGDLMNSLKSYPEDTAFRRVQNSVLTALFKTRLGRKISHATMVHETRQEARQYDQSYWAQSLLRTASEIEKNLQMQQEEQEQDSK